MFVKELFDDMNVLTVCNERLVEMSLLVETLSSLPSESSPKLKSCIVEYQNQFEAIAGDVKKQKSLLEYRMR